MEGREGTRISWRRHVKPESQAYLSLARCNLQCPILRRSLARSIDRYHIAGRGDRIGESGRPHPAVRVAACRPRRRAAPNCEQLRRSGPTGPCARRELTTHGHMSLVPLLRLPATPRRGMIGTARSTTAKTSSSSTSCFGRLLSMFILGVNSCVYDGCPSLSRLHCRIHTHTKRCEQKIS